jgi:hypothetical protein
VLAVLIVDSSMKYCTYDPNNATVTLGRRVFDSGECNRALQSVINATVVAGSLKSHHRYKEEEEGRKKGLLS